MTARNEYVPPPPPPIFRLTARAATFFAAAAFLAASLLVVGANDSYAQAGAPGSVPNITVTRADGTVTASWDAVSGATKYHAMYSDDDRGSWHGPVDDHTNIQTTSITFSADNAKSIIVGVRAGNDHGWSEWTDSPTVGPYTPGAVSSVTVTRADGTVTASWDAVPGATKYHSMYSDDDRGSWHGPVDDHTNIQTTSITFSADNAKSIIVGVRAWNDNGWSEWTDSPTVGPYTPPPPGAVPSVNVTRADGTVTASWDAVPGATKYHSMYSDDDRGSWHGPVDDHTNIQTTSITFSVDNAKSIIVGVRAGNDHGWSEWTDSPSVGPYTPATPPDAPAGLTATAGDGSVTLAWSDPSDSSITGYEYNVNHNDTGTGNFSGWSTWTAIAGSDSATTSHTLTGLTNGREYRYHLRAVNSAGNSTAAPNEAPWFASATPGISVSLTVDQVTGTTAALTLSNYDGGQWYYQAVGGTDNPNWPPAGSPPPLQGEGAGAASAQGASANNNPNCQGPVNGSQANINGSPGNSLIPGSNYTITAYDNPNCQGAGIASAQANSQSNAPDAPTNLVGHRGYGMVDAEWSHVTGATGYNVEIYWWYIGMGWHRSGTNVTGGTDSTRTHRITSTGSPTTPGWMGVPNHGQVLIAVQAVNSNGVSAWTYSTFINSVAFPTYPQNVTAARDTTGDKAGQISVSWTQCTPGASWCNGGTPITGYSINASSDNGASWTKVVETKTVSVPSASLSFCATHDRNWQVKVGVTNRLGTSWSDAVSVARYTPTPGSRNACLDFDTLMADDVNAIAIWSDATIMWVLDNAEDELQAYDMATRTRDATRDISLLDKSLWYDVTSDGTTIWLSESTTLDRLYAYDLATRARDSGKDFMLHSDNDWARGIWTDGVTMYVQDDTDNKIYAYTISGTRESGKDITLHTDNANGEALWSDGVTIWAVDSIDRKAYAYKLSDGSRDSAKDYNSLAAQTPYGIWSDGATTWILDGSNDIEIVHAYNSLVPFTSPVSVNAYRGWGFLDVEWSAVDGASSYDVEHYHAYNRSKYGSDWRRIGSGVSGTSLRITGIKNWGGDNIRVRSVSPLGDTSEWSYSGAVDAISSLPRPPSALSAVQINSGAIVLSWTQCDVSSVVCNGGTPITGYLVELSNDGGKNWRSGGKIATPYTSGSMVTVRQGVNSGVNRVRVSAETRFRNSNWTETATTGPFATNLHTVSNPNPGSTISSTIKQGVAFTTGSHQTGYTLGSVTISMKKIGSPTPNNLAITLHKMDGTSPYNNINYTTRAPSSTTLAILALTGTAPTSASYTDTVFTCSGSGCNLAPGTTYFVVASYTGSDSYQWRYSGTDTQSGAPSDNGWKIERSHQKNGASPWTSWGDWHMVRANFEYNLPSLTASSITGTSATLTISGYTDAWYYKATSGPHTTCQGPVAAGTSSASLTGLTAGSSYTYSAYSDSGCSTLLATAAQFATAVSVSNLNESRETSGISLYSDFPRLAQAFTTGTNSGGYTLKTVTAYLHRGSSQTLTVTLHAAASNGNDPSGNALVTLASGAYATGEHTFTCSGSGCDLDADTTYVIQLGSSGEIDARYEWRAISTTNETKEPSTNEWSIGDRSRFYRASNSTWNDETVGKTAALKLTATAKSSSPSLTASKVAVTTATLTVAGHSGNWYYKHTNTGATCDGPVSGKTKNLTGLTAGTSYTYSAYSDSTCTMGNLIATAAAFATAVSVSNLNESRETSGISLYSDFPRLAQAFTTGTNSGGYTLKTVTAYLHRGSSQTLTVTLHAAASNGNDPSGNALVTLASGAYATGEHTFTCSGSGCDLDADTTYVIQLGSSGEINARYEWRAISTTNETKEPSTNEWSIGDRSRFYRASNSTWNDETVGKTAALKLTAMSRPGS